MLTRITASEWETVVPQSSKGEKRSLTFSLRDWTGADIQVRSVEPIAINGITTDGETILLAWGQFAHFVGRLVGFAGVEIVASKPFAMRCREKARWLEIPDQKKVVVELDEATEKPMEAAIRAELLKALGLAQAKGMLQTDADIEELVDDIAHGDHDDDEPDDPFGLGYDDEEEEQLDFFPEREEPANAGDPGGQSAPAEPPSAPPTSPNSPST